MKREIKRRGFTLVELLIVIVVIGILSAMMMLSSTEAVSSARASNIVSNLRNLKTAALAWYLDNMGRSDGPSLDDLTPYLSGKLEDSSENSKVDKYAIETSFSSNSWAVKCTIVDATIDIKNKLKERAASVGLLKSDASISLDEATGNISITSGQYYDGSGDEVYMFIRLSTTTTGA